MSLGQKNQNLATNMQNLRISDAKITFGAEICNLSISIKINLIINSLKYCFVEPDRRACQGGPRSRTRK